MTKDLALLLKGNELQEEDYLNTEEFIDAVSTSLNRKINSSK
jgi:isocitrate dehydrogenase